MKDRTEVLNSVVKTAEVCKKEECGLVASLVLTFGFEEQSLDYILYRPLSDQRSGVSANFFIYRVMELTGSIKWSEVVGKVIRVKRKDKNILALGDPILDDWLCFEKALNPENFCSRH